MPFSPVDHGVTEKEPAKEPEDPYHEQEATANDAYVLALLKYPFYPLFILDNVMNLISKSLTVLTWMQPLT